MCRCSVAKPAATEEVETSLRSHTACASRSAASVASCGAAEEAGVDAEEAAPAAAFSPPSAAAEAAAWASTRRSWSRVVGFGGDDLRESGPSELRR